MQVGTLEYLAPEVLQRQPYSYAIDIFAWAVTVNELATGTIPYSDCTKDNPAAHTVLNFGYGRQDSHSLLPGTDNSCMGSGTHSLERNDLAVVPPQSKSIKSC